MKYFRFLSLTTSMLFAIFSLGAFAGDDWPDVNDDGLERISGSKMSVVYVEPGADLSPYSRVILIEPTVAFKKNWARKQRSGSASKLQTSSRVNTSKIKKNIASEFEIVFTETLNNGGFPVVEDAGEDVLLVRPSIVDLDINAPETHGSGRTTSYVRSAGEMTLYLELFDSATGDIIVKAIDRKIDREHELIYTWANSSSNRIAAQRIYQSWADILLEALKEAKSYEVKEEVVE